MIKKNIYSLIKKSFCIKKKDKIIIIYDNSTKGIINYFRSCFKKKKINFTDQKIPNSNFHGSEFPSKLKKKIKKFSLIICLTKFSFAHSASRKMSVKSSRFISMPGYDLKLLKHNSLSYDFKKSFKLGNSIKKIFDKGKKIKVEFDKKNYAIFDIKKRKSNLCPGYAKKNGDLASPPDSEVNISPVENNSVGNLIIRNSVATPNIGKISSPIKLVLKNGKIIKIITKDLKNKKTLNKIFLGNNKKKVCAEIGIGLNPLCKITGNMLTDEGTKGFVHFGFGSNFSVGGKNKVNFHIDFATSKLKLLVDDKIIVNENRISKNIK